MSELNVSRCPWCEGFALYRDYHDTEWGVPLRDDRRLFELLNLEGAQAGLSWATVLKKREHYRVVFDDFDPLRIADYDEAKILRLLGDAGIIRHRGKIEAVIQNAKAYQSLIKMGQSFSSFLWQFVGGKPILNRWESMQEVPAKTPESEAMSKALSKAGFRFVGPTICYAFMQAAGMVNDHLVSCHRYLAVQQACQPSSE